MNLIKQVKKLETPMFILFVASKRIVGIGLGVLLAGVLQGTGWWILILGIVLSAVSAIKALSIKE
jgi:mannose/fructose/N-acetylgalactosamine-specific phosphotransferase system component IIC